MLPAVISCSRMAKRHEFPDAYLLPKLVEDYFIFYNENKDTMHPVEMAAHLHQRLVNIHPFIDGNGRTSRLVMNLHLLPKLVEDYFIFYNENKDTMHPVEMAAHLHQRLVNIHPWLLMVMVDTLHERLQAAKEANPDLWPTIVSKLRVDWTYVKPRRNPFLFDGRTHRRRQATQ